MLVCSDTKLYQLQTQILHDASLVTQVECGGNGEAFSLSLLAPAILIHSQVKQGSVQI